MERQRQQERKRVQSERIISAAVIIPGSFRRKLKSSDLAFRSTYVRERLLPASCQADANDDENQRVPLNNAL